MILILCGFCNTCGESPPVGPIWMFSSRFFVNYTGIWRARDTSSWTHLQLLDDLELIRNYSGEVADNIE
jgi:hypothetical protein